MTAFILVSGAHTGGWIWQEVAARLRAAGAEVRPVTLTGMGDRRRPAGPETDLETHISDVVRAIDEMDVPEVVVVGHDYGIHPVLGAADRRPERIARIVNLDAGMPQDGDPPLRLVADEEVRDRLATAVAGTGEGACVPAPGDRTWLLPPPPADGWHRRGSTAGVPADALARLAALAVPQPVATLTQPLKLSGAVLELPTTGVLCTANGSSTAVLEMVVGLGDPRFQALAEPRVTFFDLETGHWPMLSVPERLADVLLRAAAGEGHRIAKAAGERPAHLGPFLLDVPECARERSGSVDLHLPEGDAPRPAVVLVHGGPVPPGVQPAPRDWPAFVGYGRYLASQGVVGVTFDHRLHDVSDYGRAAEDVAAAVEAVRDDPRVDGDRVALWFFSGGGLLSADWLAAPPPWLRCVAATYPVLAPQPSWGLSGPRFRPAGAVRGAGRLPIVLTRVGLEHAEIAATVEKFVIAAEEGGAELELIDVAQGHHGFETIDHTDEARDAVRAAVRSVLQHLRD